MKFSTLLVGRGRRSACSRPPSPSPTTISAARSNRPTVGGKEILTDSKGMTLYIWDKDAKGVSNCYDKCATAWPPVLVDARPPCRGDFTLVDRKDSDKKIVAYKGWPLYLWIKDTKPGDTTGDGVAGTWHTAVEGM